MLWLLFSGNLLASSFVFILGLREHVSVFILFPRFFNCYCSNLYCFLLVEWSAYALRELKFVVDLDIELDSSLAGQVNIWSVLDLGGHKINSRLEL